MATLRLPPSVDPAAGLWRSEFPPPVLCNRRWETLSSVQDTKSFKLLQFNLLAEGLSTSASNWGGFSRVPREILDWRRRRSALLHAMLASEPDIMCLQEVDHFADWFHPALASEGFDGVFVPKDSSPCLNFGDDKYSDGIAIFWRLARFTFLSHSIVYFTLPDGNPANQRGLIAHVRDNDTGIEIVVATTHLKAKPGAALDEIRRVAIVQLLDAVKMCARECPVIVAGDFNAEPDGPVYRAVGSHALHLSSTYGVLGAAFEPEYTTWKVRRHESKHTIDYIYFSGERSLTLLGRQAVPASESVSRARFPSSGWPSDHMSLVAQFALN